jgi:acyl-[acyl-carrier-protein]-phospholipid O-acyltransferase/long-chain-fatty-acid--[acyl-carrier-protein] ligase
MLGYLDRDDLTSKAFIRGGYNTGDIGKVDADGFIHITGRLARFAKIAGEMVPLDHVEALLAAGVPEDIELAIAAVPDEGRGERLVILHTGFTGDWNSILNRLEGQPAIWKPRLSDVHLVQALPKLGTGKRDLAGLKALALATTQGA